MLMLIWRINVTPPMPMQVPVPPDQRSRDVALLCCVLVRFRKVRSEEMTQAAGQYTEYQVALS